jgi:tRNA A37 threonylcarbamoyladenosine synthetase subunit TsaC/SUA5/YrdC
MTDPELIHERYGKSVEAVINGGIGKIVPSTVVDCSDDEPEIVRQGQGELIL